MKKCKELCIYLLICLFLSSILSVSYGEESNQIKIEDIKLNSIYYEDENYLYFKIDKRIARLKKDLTGQYEILSEEDKNFIDEMETNKESFTVKGIEIQNKEIEISGDYLYHNGLKLLDIKKYIDEDNEFYKQHPKSERIPMTFHMQKYILNDNRTLYSITIYTCLVVSAPYTPRYQNYILVEDGAVKLVDLKDESFVLEDVYINNNRLWMNGYHRYSWHNIHKDIYYLDDKGNMTDVDEVINNLNSNVRGNGECLEIRLVGMNNESIVFQELVEDKKNGIINFRLNALYGITHKLEIKRLNIDVSIVNEKYTKQNEMLYLGKNNEIYYISDNIHGVVNLTNGQFKRFGLNINDTDENNCTQVPFRETLEKIGAKVIWINETRTAIAEKDGIKIEVPIDEKFILKNGERIENDTKILINNGRIYLPIKVIMEAFGYEEEWDGK